MADPYVLSADEAAAQESELKSTVVGLVCPKQHKTGTCKVCDYIQTLWEKKPQKGDPVLSWISDYKAKANYFLNVVLPANPNKSFLLEIGSNAGSDILNGIKTKEWTMIANPNAGQGHEMLITKFKGDSGFNAYNPSPRLSPANWSVPDDVLANLINLDDVPKMVINNELTPENHMKVSSLKMDETLTFRICPPAKASIFQGRVMIIVWRHWGVTQGQINGTEPIKYEKTQTSEKTPTQDSVDIPWDQDDRKKVVTEETKTVTNTAPSTLPCFGKVKEGVDTTGKKVVVAKYFEEDDQSCIDCVQFKACAKEITKQIESDINI